MNRQAIVEYWDSRAAVDLFENMNGKPFEGGTLDMKYIWDEPPPGQQVSPEAVRRSTALHE
jgi:hypothetical protein